VWPVGHPLVLPAFALSLGVSLAGPRRAAFEWECRRLEADGGMPAEVNPAGRAAVVGGSRVVAGFIVGVRHSPARQGMLIAALSPALFSLVHTLQVAIVGTVGS